MKKIFLLILYISITNFIIAQVEIDRDVISTAGAEVTVGNLHLSWTAGEIVTETFPIGGLVICLGFQQIRDGLDATEEPIPQSEVNVYPNPTASTVFVTSKKSGDMQLELFDIVGKSLSYEQAFISESPTEISLIDLPAGIYLLKLTDDDQSSITLKLQKTN